MTDQITFNPLRALDANGDPSPGAIAYFYAPGTTSDADVYADADLTILQENPLTADGSGFFPQVFVSTEVKVDMTDADGATLPGFPLDPAPLSPVGGSGASAISFTPTALITSTNVQDAIEEVRDLLPTTISASVTSILEADDVDEILTALGLSPASTGNYTPVVVDATTSGNEATVETAFGSYVTIFGFCVVNVRLFNIDTTGMTGGNTMYISLPFEVADAPANGGVSVGATEARFITYTGDYLVVAAEVGESLCTIKQVTTTANSSALTVASVDGATSDILFTLIYKVA